VTREEIDKRLRELLVERFGVDAARLTPEARLFQDLDLDSIDAIDMAVELQAWTGRRLPEEALRSIRTLSDVVTLVEAHLAAAGDVPEVPPFGST
jgi:acyl carrier protein